MKSHTPASRRTAVAVALAVNSTEPERALREVFSESAPGTHQVPSAAEHRSTQAGTVLLEQVLEQGRELKGELQRIRDEYPPAAKLKSELIDFGQRMKERHNDLSSRVDELFRKMDELAAWLQKNLSEAAPAPELQQELQRIRETYPSADRLEARLTDLFGHPDGRMTRLEDRVGAMDERMTGLALRLQQLEDAAPSEAPASPRKKSRK